MKWFSFQISVNYSVSFLLKITVGQWNIFHQVYLPLKSLHKVPEELASILRWWLYTCALRELVFPVYWILSDTTNSIVKLCLSLTGYASKLYFQTGTSKTWTSNKSWYYRLKPTTRLIFFQMMTVKRILKRSERPCITNGSPLHGAENVTQEVIRVNRWGPL